jgi:hypothetical protein
LVIRALLFGPDYQFADIAGIKKARRSELADRAHGT